VFTEDLLRPESQDLATFADGVSNIVEAQKAAAQLYFDDGSVENACPPLRVLLHIMRSGNYEGKTAHDPEIRRMFTREALLSSDWYKARLLVKQEREVRLWKRHVAQLTQFLNKPGYEAEAVRLGIKQRLGIAKTELEHVSGDSYLGELVGSIGADPICRQPHLN